MAEGKDQSKQGRLLFTDFDVSEKGRPAAVLDNSAAGIVSTLSNIGNLASSLDFGFESDDDEPPPPKRPAAQAASPPPAVDDPSPRRSRERGKPTTPPRDASPGPAQAGEALFPSEGMEPGVYVPPELDAGAAVTTWHEYANAFRRRRGPAAAPVPLREAEISERGRPPPPGGGAAAEAFKQLSAQSAAYGGIDAAPDTALLSGAGAMPDAADAGEFDVLSLLNLPEADAEAGSGAVPRPHPDGSQFENLNADGDAAQYVLPTDWYDRAGEAPRGDPMAALLDLAELFPDRPPETAAGAEPEPGTGRPGRRPDMTRSIDLFTGIDLEAIWRERHAAAGSAKPGQAGGGTGSKGKAAEPPAAARPGGRGDTHSLDTRYLDLFGDVDLDSLWERKVRDREERGDGAGNGPDGNDVAATMIFSADFGQNLTQILSGEKQQGGIGAPGKSSGKGQLPGEADPGEAADLLAELAGAEQKEADAFKEIAREIDAAETVALSEGGEAAPEEDEELLILDDAALADALHNPKAGGGASGEDTGRVASAGERMRSRMERLRREYEAEKKGGGGAAPAEAEGEADTSDTYDPFEDAMPGSVGGRNAAARQEDGEPADEGEGESEQSGTSDYEEGDAAYEEGDAAFEENDAAYGESDDEPARPGVTADDLLNEGFDDLPDADAEVSAPVVDDSDIESGRKGPKPGTEEMLAIVDSNDGEDGEAEGDFGDAEVPRRRRAARGDGSGGDGEAGVSLSSGKSGGGAKDPADMFSDLDAMDFSDDMDDEMRSMMDDEDGAEPGGGEGDDLGLDMQMALAPLPKTGVRLLLSRVGKFICKYLPMRYIERLDRMVAWRENWWFYCDLLAAIIASASLAVIISYYIWYKE